MKPTILREIEALVAARRTFVHATHVNPDADGLGSALAFSRWLVRQGKDSKLLLPSPVPKRLQFLFRPGEVEIHRPGTKAPTDQDVFILYDVSTIERLGALTPVAKAWPGPRVVFDHHDGVVDFPAVEAVDRDAGATAQLVFEAFDAWGVEMDLDLALPIYVGLIADTGSFNYGKTTPRTHLIAARLLEAGVDPLAVHGQLEGSHPLAAVRTAGKVMASIEVDVVDPRIAHATLPAELWREAGAEALDSVSLVNHTISLEGVLAGFLLVHVAETTTRLSLRSKNAIDVMEVAASFGGGGHRNAAGATIHGAPDAVRGEVLARLRSHLAGQAGPPSAP